MCQGQSEVKVTQEVKTTSFMEVNEGKIQNICQGHVYINVHSSKRMKEGKVHNICPGQHTRLLGGEKNVIYKICVKVTQR